MFNILVPVDFSHVSQKAANYALKILEVIEGELTVFHSCYINQPGASSLVDIQEVVYKDSVKDLEKFTDSLKLLHPNIKINMECTLQDLYFSLNNISLSKKADLVVMGTTGNSGLKGFFMGSNTAEFIRKTDLPVLAVPENCSTYLPRKALLTYGCTKRIEETPLLTEMFDKFNIDIDRVYFDSESSTEESPISDLEYAKLYSSKKWKVVKVKSLVRGIWSYLSKNKYDLLVVQKRKRSFWKRLTRMSVSKQLVIHTEMPLLVLPKV
jgi:nucleotide-binding universal stress UspA family protein